MTLWFMIGVNIAQAIEIKGVPIANSVEVDGQSLLLNGASIRTKFFFDIYIGALYLSQATTSAKEAIYSQTNKRIFLYFLFGNVPKHRLTQGWTLGFERNPQVEMDVLQTRLNRFNGFFQDMKKGDSISFDFANTGTTSVKVNHHLVGKIEGFDFQQALLSVWLGSHAADDDLKAGMLGK
jgi:hypothetical protein